MDEDVVRQAPLFAALDDEAAAALKASMSRRELARAEILFHEGDPGDRLYVIIEGKVKLGRASGDGRENLLAVLGPGEMFGELSLFDPGPRNATATAVADTVLIGVGNDDLTAWLTGRPDVARQLLRALARRLRRTTRPWPTWSSRTCRGGWPRPCSTCPSASGPPPTRDCGSPTTSPRRSWLSWSVRPGRP